MIYSYVLASGLYVTKKIYIYKIYQDKYFEVIGDGRQLSVQGFQEHALVNIFSEQHFDIWILEKSLDLVFGESDKYQLFTKVNV